MHSIRFIICLLLLSTLTGCHESKEPNKTVLLSILARNKAHVLPVYLDHINQLDYDKKLITVYINTNNNVDETAQLLQDWVAKNGDQYRDVILENYDVKTDLDTDPHAWTFKKIYILGKIRNRSLAKALEHNTDYYFVSDCDNFISPSTLKTLISKDKPIIAPMLTAIPGEDDKYSNFYTEITDDGYFEDNDEYYTILDRKKVGTFKVPLVHCTYLINTKYIPQLDYLDDQDHHEYVMFARSARNNGVDQYVTNEEDFGVLLHPDETITLADEVALMQKLYPAST